MAGYGEGDDLMHPEDFRELNRMGGPDAPKPVHGKPPTLRDVLREGRMLISDKPHLRRVQHIDGVERWLCVGEGLSAIARTPEAAHALWKECLMENLRTEELMSRGWL